MLPPVLQVKTKTKAMVLIETAKRQRNKMTTSVTGLELFGIKLQDAAKIFG